MNNSFQQLNLQNLELDWSEHAHHINNGEFRLASPGEAAEEEGEGNMSGSSSQGDGTSTIEEEGEDEEPEYIPGQFEGPEKNLEVVFRADVGPSEGLRLLSRNQLDILCKKARCSIVHHVSNAVMDAYILSESSLFVYKHRFIMKTCGTTTLLRCLATLLSYCDALGLSLAWLGYSRKNLNNPQAQQWPHGSFNDELSFMGRHTSLQHRLKGTGYILGPCTADHWFVYIADLMSKEEGAIATAISPLGGGAAGRVPRSVSSPALSGSGPGPATSPRCFTVAANGACNASHERTFNLMMFDVAPAVATHFFQTTTQDAKVMTQASGIDTLCPGYLIDETAFVPCGYSMNAICPQGYYATIHITPEESCSYVSFETNDPAPFAGQGGYPALVEAVLKVFQPKRFVLTMFGDQAALEQQTTATLPTAQTSYEVKLDAMMVASYGRASLSSTQVDLELSCLMAVYHHRGTAVVPAMAEEEVDIAAGMEETKNEGPSKEALTIFQGKEKKQPKVNAILAATMRRERSMSWC